MGKGRAPSSLERYRIKDNYKDPEQAFFVSLGDNHAERVQNYVKVLDERINKEMRRGK